MIPRAIFTDPEVAVVGPTDKQAVERGYHCACRTVKMEQVPRAQAVRNPRGVIKMVAQRGTPRVLGVSMAGMDAGEVIHKAAMGVRLGASGVVSVAQLFPAGRERHYAVHEELYLIAARLEVQQFDARVARPQSVDREPPGDGPPA
jgi:pyruvate/2-oxoglutarate dehydrogenase complex dihydrolipoamide dehydrogenase (E3) component